MLRVQFARQARGDVIFMAPASLTPEELGMPVSAGAVPYLVEVYTGDVDGGGSSGQVRRAVLLAGDVDGGGSGG